ERKTMRMLVMGAGRQGSACAYDLLQDSSIDEVVVADMRTDTLPPFLERYRSDPRLRVVRVDARNIDEVRNVMKGAAACMNALPYYFNLEITRAAVDSGVNYCDLGGNTAIVFEQMKLDDEAKQKNI